MPTQIQFRRGTTSQHSSFTGAVGEITVDTDKDTLVIHDGATAGGYELARANVSNVSNPQFSGTSSLLLPVGTTAQRPASPTNGQIRYNSSTTQAEVYADSAWNPLGTVLQYEYNYDDSQANYTSTSNDPSVMAKITTLSITITPKSANSLIVIGMGLQSGNWVHGLGYFRDNTLAHHQSASKGSSVNGGFQVVYSGSDSAGGQSEPQYAIMTENSGSTTSRTYYPAVEANYGGSSDLPAWYYNRRGSDGNMDGTSYMWVMEVFQ